MFVDTEDWIIVPEYLFEYTVLDLRMSDRGSIYDEMAPIGTEWRLEADMDFQKVFSDLETIFCTVSQAQSQVHLDIDRMTAFVNGTRVQSLEEIMEELDLAECHPRTTKIALCCSTQAVLGAAMDKLVLSIKPNEVVAETRPAKPMRVYVTCGKQVDDFSVRVEKPLRCIHATTGNVISLCQFDCEFSLSCLTKEAKLVTNSVRTPDDVQ